MARRRVDWESGVLITIAALAVMATPFLVGRFGYGVGEITVIVFLVVAALAGVKGTAKIIASRREYERERTGKCIECGYDLRESHERCPECGSDVPTSLPPKGQAKPMHPVLYATILAVVAGVAAFLIMAHTMVIEMSRNSSGH